MYQVFRLYLCRPFYFCFCTFLEGLNLLLLLLGARCSVQRVFDICAYPGTFAFSGALTNEGSPQTCCRDVLYWIPISKIDWTTTNWNWPTQIDEGPGPNEVCLA